MAQHLIVDQGWKVADSNADAIRQLGAKGVLTIDAAEAGARAVGSAMSSSMSIPRSTTAGW